MSKSFLIIGSGPAGYQSALELRKAYPEAKIILIEKYKLGGACLHRGCIPSKLLGTIKDEKDFLKLLKKHKTILEKAIEQSLIKAEVEIIKGEADLYLDSETFSVKVKSCDDEGYVIKSAESQYIKEFKNIDYLILATGSRPRKINFEKLNQEKAKEKAISSDSFFCDLKLESGLADSYCFIGAGYIGVELASMLRRLGKSVRIIEMADDILSFLDKDLRERIKANLNKQGIKIETSVKNIDYEAISEDKIFVAIGRELVLPNIFSRNLGSTLDASSAQSLDEFSQILNKRDLLTELDSLKLKDRVFLVGDLSEEMPLAHYAYAEAKSLIKAIKADDKPCRPNLDHIPLVIFTDTEFAQCGMSLEKVKREYADDFFILEKSWAENAKARLIGEERSYIRFIFATEKKKLVSCSILGKSATDLISIAVPLIHLGLTYAEIADMVFPHPTLGELFVLD